MPLFTNFAEQTKCLLLKDTSGQRPDWSLRTLITPKKFLPNYLGYLWWKSDESMNHFTSGQCRVQKVAIRGYRPSCFRTKASIRAGRDALIPEVYRRLQYQSTWASWNGSGEKTISILRIATACCGCEEAGEPPWMVSHWPSTLTLIRFFLIYNLFRLTDIRSDAEFDCCMVVLAWNEVHFTFCQSFSFLSLVNFLARLVELGS